MNVSFDGLRKNATRSMNNLHSEIENILKNVDCYQFDKSYKEDLIKSFNEAAMFVDTFNCLYDDDIDGDFNNLSDLSINRIDELNYEEDED